MLSTPLTRAETPSKYRSPLGSVPASLAAVVALAIGVSGRGQDATTFRTGVDLVNIGVTVTDKKGTLVTGLQPEDFEVIEDGRRQTVSYFAAGDKADAELHVGILLDVSESMGDDIAFTRTAAIKFLNKLADAADITIVDFDTEVRVGRYGQNEFARVVERIRQQKPTGDTALYDAVGVYVDGASRQTGRKIMLLYSDGGDTRSILRFGELLDLLKASDATVYAIGQPQLRNPSSGFVQRPILQQIAETTGGQAFFPSSDKNLDTVYEQVVSEIRAQYTLGYVSTNPSLDGAWRRVEVKVATGGSLGERRVRARKGYYALYKKP